ncbi:hypothetical protein SUGI_1088510 [Cryptomeria japonica]|nr:hypothetical protein SUGI_1088510 [Cryptomeria japonica]
MSSTPEDTREPYLEWLASDAGEALGNPSCKNKYPKKDDPWNFFMVGTGTGGVFGMRYGPKAAATLALLK